MVIASCSSFRCSLPDRPMITFHSPIKSCRMVSSCCFSSRDEAFSFAHSYVSLPIFSFKQSCPRDLYYVFKAVLHHLDRVAFCQAFKVLIVKEQQVVLESPPLV